MTPVNSPYLSRAAASLHLPMPGQTPVPPQAFPQAPAQPAPLQRPPADTMREENWTGYNRFADKLRAIAAAKEGPPANFPDRFGTSGSPQLPFSGPVSTPATGAPNWPSPVMPSPTPTTAAAPTEQLAQSGLGPGALSAVPPAPAGLPAGYNPHIPDMANLSQSQSNFGPGMQARTVSDGNGGMMNDFYGPGGNVGPTSIPDWLRSKFG